jgi:hypothetical protein
MDRPMTMMRKRVPAGGMAWLGLGLLVILGASGAAAPPSVAATTCTNPASGATWQIVIDYAKATVDSNPAAISRAEISWFDPTDGGTYTLDRESGDLTVSIASSTGGYFRHGRCSLAKAR